MIILEQMTGVGHREAQGPLCHGIRREGRVHSTDRRRWVVDLVVEACRSSILIFSFFSNEMQLHQLRAMPNQEVEAK